ncbi:MULTISPECIES: ParB/RepB/Spo0J family partition protein [unclassified Paracoccus (in: a-proteobacteria)]|uniref:ParB/RepB/Spo0J family partition protein n=1 Tax=unclassified Paracoccus (in: a-proteobacteria) TaxID=2688777 RepID=UPI000FDA9F25|nr:MULTISPECIES: ParB/RepB/Spo0J family partition protein [unclassified Paracoccus (in: a-proteobacteria)]AZY95629.1 ParB/RepB/Spo0J family partition protein [Paracoccus sp. Arc7-R13]MCO6364477.1 ParB/RepB/Spo0J family partition protein [Paracoccus sp. 08]
MARKPKLGLPLQTLRNAPDALEGRRLRGGIFEIETGDIDTTGRLDDRLHIEIESLKVSISKNGQRVPILVCPIEGDRYRLIYGRRRLEACRELGIKVRAIVTEVESDQPLRDQLLENQERRDLSFIERALVAAALLDGDHLNASERTNKGIAEVLNLTEAGVSQLLSVVRTVGENLVLAIGAAPGIGRPRWEELKKLLGTAKVDREWLAAMAADVRTAHQGGIDEKSDQAFLAVLLAAGKSKHAMSSSYPRGGAGTVIPGVGAATVTTGRRGKQLKLELKAEESEFVSWLEGNAPRLIAELHERWKRSED